MNIIIYCDELAGDQLLPHTANVLQKIFDKNGYLPRQGDWIDIHPGDYDNRSKEEVHDIHHSVFKVERHQVELSCITLWVSYKES